MYNDPYLKNCYKHRGTISQINDGLHRQLKSTIIHCDNFKEFIHDFNLHNLQFQQKSNCGYEINLTSLNAVIENKC